MIFRIVVNGDSNHPLNRAFQWSADARAHFAALKACEEVHTLELWDNARGNYRDPHTGAYVAFPDRKTHTWKRETT